MSENHAFSSRNEGRLSDLVELVRDKFTPTVGDVDVRCVNLEDIPEGAGRAVSWSKASENLSIKTKFEAGDILFGKLRPYLRKYAQPSFAGLCTSELLAFRAKPGVDRRYAYQVVASQEFIDHCVAASFGTKMPRTDWRTASAFSIRIPGETEQRRIADLLSAVDEQIEASWARAKKLKATKIALAENLLHTDATGLPYPIMSLSQLIGRLESGVSVNAEDRPVAASAEKGVLKTSCVLGGAFLAHENKTILKSDISRARISPKRGCVIISRMNTPDLVGECGLVEADYPNLYLPDRLWQALPVSAETSFAWLNECLQWGPVRKRVKDAATGTSNSMKNISKGAFLAIEVPVPPPDTQRSIAGALSALGQAIASEVECVRKLTKVKHGLAFDLLGVTSGPVRAQRNLANGGHHSDSTRTSPGRCVSGSSCSA